MSALPDQDKTSGTHLSFERNFDLLLFDSLEFLLRAKELHEVDEGGQRYARASIVFSLLLLEAAANTCIESLDLESTVHSEVDRLPVLGKFDFFLRTRFKNRSLERGVDFINWVKELKSLRDGLVHLKHHKVRWIGTPDEGMSTNAVRTKALNVPTNPSFWGADDAAQVARGVHGFLGHFFRTKCKFGPKKVASFVFSDGRVPGGPDHFYPCMPKAAKSRLEQLGLDLSYIRILWVL